MCGRANYAVKQLDVDMLWSCAKYSMQVLFPLGAPPERRRALFRPHPEREAGPRTVHFPGKFDCCCCYCFLTLTDPLRIQPWSQRRRNETKSNRESEMSMESRQKRKGRLQREAAWGSRRFCWFAGGVCGERGLLPQARAPGWREDPGRRYLVNVYQGQDGRD